ncbi:MAG: penicillin-binding protein 1C [Prolixibacteraceae bacterium]|nr:penicillin-binding protein 1C [Prolixibacteraceae bacterium]
MNRFFKKIVKSRRRWFFVTIFSGILVFLIIPVPRFDDPSSTVVFSAENNLLGARIAGDGQWRFPKTDSVPEKYETALLAFEDKWFYYHPGINPVSLARALWLNIKYRQIVSGGSTLTMQVARLSRDNPPRTIGSKLLEMAMALKLELLRSKKEILCRYASSAPFGGNVVGIDAASWRYYNRPSYTLSWAEAATLAVLPNAPSLIYPGKNSAVLKKKRDGLLLKLLSLNKIDSLTFRLSIAESLPLQPKPLPALASHVVENMAAGFTGQNVKTTLLYDLQCRVEDIVARHNREASQNDIHNFAALVIDIESGNILVYVGNAPDPGNLHGGMVDVVTAPRSTGSILKPFLYAAMLQYGEILPNTLVKDIPINFSGYAPKNFDFSYSGAVPASRALSRSLNVPAVEMLVQFGEARFLDVLRSFGFTTFKYPAEHYGLSLILGGGEATLLELAGAYASMARVLLHYNEYGGYNNSDFRLPSVIPSSNEDRATWDDQPIISASSVWFTLRALQQVNRPDERSGWWNFSSSGKVAWKTGTSFGFRDAWAIATTSRYVVAVWAGNASGEGRAGLTGSKIAAPVLFDILDLLPKDTWFEKPLDEITTVEVCSESGYIASQFCPDKVNVEIPVSGLKTGACPYHRIVHLSKDRLWQVNSSCYSVAEMVQDSCFILPPGMEWYYRKLHPGYNVLPPIFEGCESPENYPMIELIYPRNLSKLYVPLEMNGERGRIVFEAAHRNMGTRIFWHLDETFIGETDHYHQMALCPAPGNHTLLLVDKDGNTLKKKFFIVTDVHR